MFKKIKKVSLFTLCIVLTLALMPVSSFAQTGITTTSSYDSLPVNHVELSQLSLKDAVFQTTNSAIKKTSSYSIVNMDNGNVSQTTAIYYQGSLNFGTANRTVDDDAVMSKTNISGSFSLRWSNKATLSDGSKADVLITYSDWVVYLGKKPSDISVSSFVMGILHGKATDNAVEYFTAQPRTGLGSNTALSPLATKQSIKSTIQILKPGTNEPIDSKYQNILIAFKDLDVMDNTLASGKTDAQKYAGPFSEGIALVSGFSSPAYVTSPTYIVSQIVDGNQKFRGSQNDSATMKSGVILSAKPQGYSYIWSGSTANTVNFPGGLMGTSLQPLEKVSIFASAGPGGSIEKPGSTAYILNGQTTYDYTPERGYKVKSLTVDGSPVEFNEAGGTYTFDKIIDTNRTPDDHTIDVQFVGPKVEYEWVGEHPNKVPPEKEEVTPGNYDVDTTYKTGDTVRETNVTYNGVTYPEGVWTFKGWDKDPNIEVYEDTLIRGIWEFSPSWKITTEVVNGNITENITDIPTGENKTVSFTPDDGYQLLTVEVDGKKVIDNTGTKHDNMSEYPFNAINANHHVKVVYEKIPHLAIEKKADKKHYSPGEEILYTVKVSQTVEGANARGVKVSDVIPDALKLVSGSLEGGEVETQSDNAYTINLGTIETSKTYTYKCIAKNVIDAHDLVNVVTASAANNPSEIVRAEETVNVHVPEPELIKTVDKKTALRDDILTYTIKATQKHSDTKLLNATITDSIPEGTEYVEDSFSSNDDVKGEVKDGILTVNLGDLGTKEFTYKVKVTKREGEVLNTAVLDGYVSKDIKMPNPLKATATTNITPPKMTLDKKVNKTNTDFGDILTYTINANQITKDAYAKEVVVFDKLPEGTEYVKGSLKYTVDDKSKKYIDDNNLSIETSDEISVKIPRVYENTKVTFEVKVTAKEGEIKNVAELDSPDIEKLTANAISKLNAPRLVIKKTANKKSTVLGDKVEYTVKFKSEGGTAINAVLRDKIPEELKLQEKTIKISDDSAKVEVQDNTITVSMPKLSKETIMTYTVQTTKRGSFVNTVILNAENVKKSVKDDETIKVGEAGPPSKTGDDFSIWLFGSLAVISAIVGLISLRRKKVKN